MKVLCPNCNKEIINQAEVQIPSSPEPIESESTFFPKQEPTVLTQGNLIYKDEKYYLVFESIVICPNCKEEFAYDIWLPTAEPQTI
jgi:hypothetical protein